MHNCRCSQHKSSDTPRSHRQKIILPGMTQCALSHAKNLIIIIFLFCRQSPLAPVIKKALIENSIFLKKRHTYRNYEALPQMTLAPESKKLLPKQRDTQHESLTSIPAAEKCCQSSTNCKIIMPSGRVSIITRQKLMIFPLLRHNRMINAFKCDFID